MVEDIQENYLTGWVKIFRSIRNHWIWKDPIRFQWWIDILLEVNHSPKTFAIGYKLFDCEKGECLMSLQNWSLRWGVSKTVVNNFLKLLEKDSMIIIKNETVTTRITVCNFETYQQNQNGNKTQQKRDRNATETQQYTTKEDKKIRTKEVYTYSQFYDEQLELSENNQNYLLLIKWLFGDNIYKRPLEKVLNMKEQLSWKQFDSLLEIHKTTGLKIRTLLEELENWLMKNPKAKNSTVLGTLRTFAKRSTDKK